MSKFVEEYINPKFDNKVSASDLDRLLKSGTVTLLTPVPLPNLLSLDIMHSNRR